MNATPLEGYDYHVVAPEHHAGLRCRFLRPHDFRVTELPDETFEFDRRAAFLPLVVALTPKGPMVFSAGARPAHSSGIVAHWLGQLCRAEGFAHGAITETRIGGHPAVTCDAIQKADGMVLKMRLVLIEDGGRLFQITAMAPEHLWARAEELFAPMLASFEITDAQGPTVPLFG